MQWKFTNDDQTITINLGEDSSNGRVWGTVQYDNKTFPVTGLWQAENGGNNANRKVSNLMLSGQVDAAPNQPEFLALSGLIKGTAPNMGPFDLSVHTASSATGARNQLQTHLATPVSETDPPQSSAPSVPSPDIAWSLCSLDGRVQSEIMVGGGGGVMGYLTIDNRFVISGHWAASGVQGRAASAFEFTGHYEVAPDAWDLLAVAGTMTGPAHFPQKIELSGNIASISEYKNTPVQATLLPKWQSDGNLGPAYAESYMVIEMGGDGGDSRAVRGWIGPRDNSGMISPFGSSNYQSVGTPLTQDELDSITNQNTQGGDIKHIDVPGFNSAASSRPVMIQFPGPSEHFPQPPLMEYHPDIARIFYDGAASALVLQFTDVAGAASSGPINFNHGHGSHSGKNHNSVIIEPR